MLTAYAGAPAIFYQQAPGDLQKGWSQGKQYPRIVFDLLKQADTERKTSGTLVVSILCNATETDPEAISPLVESCLKNIVMIPDDDSPYCFAWRRSDPFELENNQQNARSVGTIIGMEIRFDLLEYAEQITTDPDPVIAINEVIKAEFPDAFVLGLDDTQGVQEASDTKPIIYVRVQNHEVDYQSFALAWMKCRMAIHVIAPSTKSRSLWVRKISNQIAIDGEALMSDGSPILYTGSSANNTFDYLATGQITLDTRYSIIRLKPGDSSPLSNIKIRR